MKTILLLSILGLTNSVFAQIVGSPTPTPEATIYMITCAGSSDLRNQFSGSFVATVNNRNGACNSTGSMSLRKPGGSAQPPIENLQLEGTAAIEYFPPGEDGDPVPLLQFKLRGAGVSYASLADQGNLTYANSSVRIGITRYFGKCKVEKKQD